MSGTIVPGTPLAHVETDAPIVPRCRRPRCRNANVWRCPAEVQGSGGEPRSGVDVVVVGAGVAGIAAARRIVAAGRKCVVLEASGVVGGRCITDTALFGVPYDRGARALHTPESNPVVRLATQNGFDIYPAPPGQRMRIARRYARESEMEDMLAAMVRANAAIAEVARKADVATAQALPKDLGEWRSTVEFMLGPVFLRQGRLRDLGRRSRARRRARRAGLLPARPRRGDREARRRLPCDCRRRPRASIGAAAPASRSRPRKERIDARAVIVTASTNVLAAGKLQLHARSAQRLVDLIERLKLGSSITSTLELAGNPLGLRTDELVFERSSRRAPPRCSPTCPAAAVYGGRRRPLRSRPRRRGPEEMVAFALDWLDNLDGPASSAPPAARMRRNWNAEPWVLGAMSAAAPGAQVARRRADGVDPQRIWFAGEAAHERLWGTVGGAWESGDRAAAAALRVIVAAGAGAEAAAEAATEATKPASGVKPMPRQKH